MKVVVFRHGPLKPGESPVFTVSPPTPSSGAKRQTTPLPDAQVMVVGIGSNQHVLPPRR